MTQVVRRQRRIGKAFGIHLGCGPATGDKLTKVASNFLGEGTVTYTLGGDQKRRSRAVSGGDTTKYRYDQGWSVLNEETGGGTLQATYVHSPTRQIGTVLATSAGSTASSGTWNYYFQDAIGSTRGLWDQDALRLGKYEYTPFGGKYGDHGEDITRKFTGHDWDADARLYYTAYRYYSPDANRWLTRDPLGMVDGPNVYAYVMGNPVGVWDHLGLCGEAEGEQWIEDCYSALADSVRRVAYGIQSGFGDYLLSGSNTPETMGVARAMLMLAVLDVGFGVMNTLEGVLGMSAYPNTFVISESQCRATRRRINCLVAHEVYHAISGMNRSRYVMGSFLMEMGMGRGNYFTDYVYFEETRANGFARAVLGCRPHEIGDGSLQ